MAAACTNTRLRRPFANAHGEPAPARNPLRLIAAARACACAALSQGKKLVFVTNNSTKSRAGYLGKFTSLGLNINAVGGGG